MTCEYSKDCGFHNYLVDQGAIGPEDSCGKKNNLNCPRYRQANGTFTEEEMKQASKIFRTHDLYGSELPISNEEVQIAIDSILKEE